MADGPYARSGPSVSLITNCYEATYRKVLCAEYWTRLNGDMRRPFSRRVAIINNISDRRAAEKLAARLLRRGSIDEYYFVADHIEQALSALRLEPSALGRIPYYTNWALVAVHCCKTDYLVHCDAEVHMLQPHDWITPSIQQLEARPDALVAKPLWSPDRFSLPKIRAENFAEDEDFLVGYGFSDQLFLARTADLCRPIYDYTHPLSLRYPLSHIAPIFEQRLDSYMRRAGKARLTYKHAAYSHPKQLEGASYPCMQLTERLRWHANRAVVTVYKAFARQI